MKILIDTNIVLDFLLQREPFFQDAELLFQKIDSGHVVGYVTATTLTDIFYISRRHTRSIDQARQAVSEMLTAMIICPVNRAVLESAFGSGLADERRCYSNRLCYCSKVRRYFDTRYARFFEFIFTRFINS